MQMTIYSIDIGSTPLDPLLKMDSNCLGTYSFLWVNGFFALIETQVLHYKKMGIIRS